MQKNYALKFSNILTEMFDFIPTFLTAVQLFSCSLKFKVFFIFTDIVFCTKFPKVC